MTMGIVNFIAVCLPFLRFPFLPVRHGINALTCTQSFVFADSENSLTARHVRSDGAVADKVLDSHSSQRSFKLSPTGSLRTRPADGLPTYRQVSITRPAESLSHSRFPVNISSPVREKITNSPTAPYPHGADVTMPDLAHLPAMQPENFV